MTHLFRTRMPFGVALLHVLLGWEYVFIVNHQNERHARRVRHIGLKLYADSIYENTYVEISPGGKASGCSFEKRWEPITPETVDFFNRTETST